MADRVLIDGELHEISPKVWEIFEGWWGDKAYRQAGFVALLEKTVREQVALEIEAREDDSWPLAGPRAARRAADVARGEWEDPEPTYWFCNSCGEEVQDESEDCCEDGENEPSYEGACNG